VHLQRNAMAYVPRLSQRKLMAEHLRHIFNAPDREEAERLLEMYAKKWDKPAQELAAWMRKNIPDNFGAFVLPPQARRRLRSNNAAERLNREIKRFTRVAVIFPNTTSVERLISVAVLIEGAKSGKRKTVHHD
jgi:putative transposase